MENASSPLVTSITTTTTVSPNSSQFPLSPNSAGFPANLLENQNFSVNFASMYHSIFPPISSLPSSLSLTPSPRSSADDDHNHNHNLSIATSCTSTDDVLVRTRLILEYRELSENHDLCLHRLGDLTKEAEYLLRENAELRLANTKLVKLVSSNTAIDQDLLATTDSALRCLFKDNQMIMKGEEVAYDTISPTSVIRNSQFEGRNAQKKPALQGYNQGMKKTELCNKWEEMGGCPYGDKCRFAHGLEELRPVTRHPRYKTEVCKMVLAGLVCPYAHRCHFRHS